MKSDPEPVASISINDTVPKNGIGFDFEIGV
jgi:hypothetical protein